MGIILPAWNEYQLATWIRGMISSNVNSPNVFSESVIEARANDKPASIEDITGSSHLPDEGRTVS